MGVCAAGGQTSGATAPQPAGQTQPDPVTPEQQPCVPPEPLFSMDDYDGPLSKIVAAFSRKLEIKTVHAPHHRAHKLCGLDAGDKFNLFVKNNLEPVTFVGAAFNAGIAQAENSDAKFGQGMAGYGRRYGAALADTVASDFFHTFVFPVLFRQDPRYYRKREGTTGERLGHALTHVFVARSDSGKRMFNCSEWLGSISANTLSNTYHPGNRRGVEPVAERVGYSVGSDMGFDVLREFWPEIVHKFRLPFRDRDHAYPDTR